MSYITRKHARQNGHKSNDASRMFQPPAVEFSGAGHESENSHCLWIIEGMQLKKLDFPEEIAIVFRKSRSRFAALFLIEKGLAVNASVIIPLLHQVDSWLHNAIRSALDQTVGVEVIVITSRSTPHSNIDLLENLREHHHDLIVKQQGGQGFANALNEGIQIARSPRVGFLLSDDWLLPTAVERCLGYNSAIVSTSLRVFAADGTTLIEGAQTILNRVRFDSLKTLESKADYLSHFFLFDREALLNIDGLDETIGDAPGIDDYDLIWTLLEHGATVSVVDEPLYCYRDHELERLTLQRRAEQVRTLSRILDKHSVNEPERSAILDAHKIWFGRTIQSVLNEPANPATNP